MNVDDSKMSFELRSRIRDLASPAKNEYRCSMVFDPAFTGFEGHFEGNPIVPGVCLIEAARVIAEEVVGARLKTLRIAQCRFRRPIFAGETAAVTLKVADAPTPGVRNVRGDFRVEGAVSAQLYLEAAQK